VKNPNRNRRPQAKISNRQSAVPNTRPPAAVKPLTPLLVKLNYPFFPPGTSADEKQKVLASHNEVRSELVRRQLRLVDVVSERIRQLDDMPENNTPEFTQDVLDLAQTYGIDIQKALADAASAPKDDPSGTSGKNLSPKISAINRELLRRRKWQATHWYLGYCLKTLVHAVVEEKNEEAAVALADMAQKSVAFLSLASAICPDLFKQYASRVESWPALVDHTGVAPDWVAQLTTKINLAADTIKPRIKNAQGGSEARDWAQAILETLEQTRKNIQGPPAIPHMERLLEKEVAVTFSPIPEWAMRCKTLPAFGPDKATLNTWKEVGAMMLRTEYPEFAKHKDWDRFNMRWKNMGGREKATRIVDGIKDAMETLAGARPRKRS